jgi:hypothetical protein
VGDRNVAARTPKGEAMPKSPESVTITLPDGARAGWPVVIDALIRAKSATGLDMTFGGLIEQIRSQTIPKPNEPEGLGAVVEDSKGHRWVKIDVHLNCNDWTTQGAGSNQRGTGVRWDYADIDAVRILSEGATA